MVPLKRSRRTASEWFALVISLTFFLLIGIGPACKSQDVSVEELGLPADPLDVAVVRDFDDRCEVVSMVLDAIQMNAGRINTWKGEMFVQDRQYLDILSAQQLIKVLGEDPSSVTGPLTRVDQGIIGFAYDAESNRVFSSFQLNNEPSYLDADTAKPIYTSPRVPYQRSILTAEHYLHMDPTMEFAELRIAPDVLPKFGPVAFREEAAQGLKQSTSMVFDPRRLVGRESRLIKFFRQLLTTSTEGEDHDGELTNDERKLASKFLHVRRLVFSGGERIAYRIQLGPLPERDQKLIQTLTVDSKAGFNVIQETAFVEDRLVSQSDWKYRKEKGAFMPIYHRTMNSTPDGKNMAFERTLKLRRSSVNEPLHESTFSYENLGMSEGDRLEDRIAQKIYVLKSGKLVPAQLSTHSLPQSESEWPVTRLSLIVINAVVVLLILLFLARRRFA